MADRYLLESSAVDGYLLEDGTGVLLLEVPPVVQTTLYLRDLKSTGITDSGDGHLYDMIPTPGAVPQGALRQNYSAAATVGGTDIQFKKSTLTVAWISGPAPVGGFTLTWCKFEGWFFEDLATVNAKGRFRLLKRQVGGGYVTIGGGPFDDDVEIDSVDNAIRNWESVVTPTSFAEDERLVLRVYITNIGTMAEGLATLYTNAASGLNGHSWLGLAEAVTFKQEPVPFPVPRFHRPNTLARL